MQGNSFFSLSFIDWTNATSKHQFARMVPNDHRSLNPDEKLLRVKIDLWPLPLQDGRNEIGEINPANQRLERNAEVHREILKSKKIFFKFFIVRTTINTNHHYKITKRLWD